MSFLLCLCLGLLVLAPSLAHSAVLGIPGNGTKLSGIGVISGWKCEAEGDLTIVFNDDGKHIPLLYGTERTDVRKNGQCLDNDHDNVGFVAIWNWGNLGDGEHSAVAYDNGEEFDESTFEVNTLGGATFVRGASAEVSVPDFPVLGETAHFVWNQGTQHLELGQFSEAAPPSARNHTDLYGTWQFTTDEPYMDEWTLHSRGTTSDVAPFGIAPLATGSAERQYHALGGWIEDIAPDLNCKYDYTVYWETSLSCNIHAFNLTSSTRAEGIRAFAQPLALQYFYEALEASSRSVDDWGNWWALTNYPNHPNITGSTTIQRVADHVWHFTVFYEDDAGVSHATYYDKIVAAQNTIAATDDDMIAELGLDKWTIDLGKVRLQWDIVAASTSITMDDMPLSRLAIDVRPGAAVRNRDGSPASPSYLKETTMEDLHSDMYVVRVIGPCGPYSRDYSTTGVRTRPLSQGNEVVEEPQEGAALLRAVEAVCEE